MIQTSKHDRIGVFVGGSPLPEVEERLDVSTDTPWGEASDQPSRLKLGAIEYVFIRRHGPAQEKSPHQINYRANVWLLKELGVSAMLGTHTVGSIDPELSVGDLALPTQLIDYTWGRASTYDDRRRHIEFSEPYNEALRQQIMATDIPMATGGTYGCTQGPRLETSAEIVRMARDGCTLVGMTGMPEAGLAGELEVPYASLCVVVNPAAGIGTATIDMEALHAASRVGADKIWRVLLAMGRSQGE